MSKRLIALALSLSAASLAHAAEPVASLVDPQGTVMVNAGEEFVTAAESQALLAGQRVMVMEGGSASLAFVDGCVIPLEAGSMTVVPEQSPCAGGVASVQPVGRSYAQAVGSRGGSSMSAGAAGGIIVGVTSLAAIAIANMDEEFDVPVSP